jgi:hypothetical protein
MNTYLEKPGNGTRPLSHLSVYEHNPGFTVEEVVGEIDSSGRRKGTIVTLATGLTREDADRRYRQALEERRQQGFRPAAR